MLAIVVDSTAALSRGEAQSLGVTMVANTYVMDGQSLAEGFVGENAGYASALEDGRLVETHAPQPAAFEMAFSRLIDAGNNVLCITISSRLASTYRNACKAADIVGSKMRTQGKDAPKIAILDSLSGFSNIEWLARRARELEGSGLSFEDIIRTLVEDRGRQGVCFSVLTLDRLRASGRLSMVPLSVNTTLNRHPVFTMSDGAIACVDMARGIDALARRMVQEVPANTNDLIIAHYGFRASLVVELFHAAKEAFPHAKIRVKDAGPVLSCSLGPGAASIAWAPSSE